MYFFKFVITRLKFFFSSISLSFMHCALMPDQEVFSLSIFLWRFSHTITNNSTRPAKLSRTVAFFAVYQFFSSFNFSTFYFASLIRTFSVLHTSKSHKFALGLCLIFFSLFPTFYGLSIDIFQRISLISSRTHSMKADEVSLDAIVDGVNCLLRKIIAVKLSQ